MATKLPWQRKWYLNNSCILNRTEFIFGIKISWDNRHYLHTSMLQQLSCHGNYSDTSITPLSLDVLSSYLAWHFRGTLNMSQIIRYYGYWVAMATTVIPQLFLCLKLYWIHIWHGAQGVDLACLQTGISRVFLGFEFQKMFVFFWVLVTSAVFFGLLNKCCILIKCFIFLTVFLGPVLCPRYSVIIVLHYYHIMIHFCC